MSRVEIGDGAASCRCPSRDGKVYHDRATCTDPVAARLNWYADEVPERPVFEATHIEWPCEAYGTKGLEIGALCFVGREGFRGCPSAAKCHEVMTEERQRVFNRIHRLAAAGIEDFVYLAQMFTSPDQLLGGGNLD